MKTYMGYASHKGGPGIVSVHTDRGSAPLNPRYDLRNHSPDGFAWGYGGSGAAQLALALLCDVVGDERAQALYQRFKFGVVATLDQDAAWNMTAAQIEKWAAETEKLMAVAADAR